MLGRQYLSRQVATLLRFAKSINDPDLSGALIEKAADLKSRLESMDDKSPAAPDVEVEPTRKHERGSFPAAALEPIVDAYVHLNNRQALEGLKTHRERLAADLKGRTGWFDYSALIGQIEQEIAVVEAGLVRLNSSK